MGRVPIEKITNASNANPGKDQRADSNVISAFFLLVQNQAPLSDGSSAARRNSFISSSLNAHAFASP